MAVLNVTPDSFSDGGRFADAEAAAAEGARYADLGAAVVDIGGECTRPRGKTYGDGAPEILLEGELARVLPVLSRLRKSRPSIPISIDTRRTEVARAALDEGADIVNVVTGLAASDDLLQLVASRGAAIVLNHCRGTPSTTFEESLFSDVVSEVAADLAAARERAISAGVDSPRIFLDPGLGFGKSPSENFVLLGVARPPRAARHAARGRSIPQGFSGIPREPSRFRPAARVVGRRSRRFECCRDPPDARPRS